VNILVFGAGAIGSVFGGFLAKKGHNVFLIGRKKHMQAIKNFGLHISGIWGKHKIKNLNTFTSKSLINKNINFDFILITVKSYDTETAVKEIFSFLSKDTYVISLQNGLGNVEKIASIVGKERTIGGRVIFGVEMKDFGKFEITVYAEEVMIGKILKRDDKKIDEIAKIFTESGIPTKKTKKIEDFIWGKVLYNCALNGLGAILNVRYGELLENSYTKEIMKNIIYEIFEVIKRKNIKLKWKDADEYINILFKKLIPKTSNHYPSMLQDIRNNKRTEIDSLNGAIVNLANELKIKVPTNYLITNLIKFKENVY
jgi:2-dehydropantoate 2-reductase